MTSERTKIDASELVGRMKGCIMLFVIIKIACIDRNGDGRDMQMNVVRVWEGRRRGVWAEREAEVVETMKSGGRAPR